MFWGPVNVTTMNLARRCDRREGETRRRVSAEQEDPKLKNKIHF